MGAAAKSMGAAAGSAGSAIGTAARAANTAAKGLINTVGKVAAVVPVAAGAAQTIKENYEPGFRDEYQQKMGVETPLGSVAADTMRFLANTGNFVTNGYAGKLGQGISNWWNSPSEEAQPQQPKLSPVEQEAQERASQLRQVQEAQASAPALPNFADVNPYAARELRGMGVPNEAMDADPVVDSARASTRELLRTGGTSEFQNLGTYGGQNNIYGRSTDPNRPGRINEFVGVGDAPAYDPQAETRRAMNSLLRDMFRRSERQPQRPAVGSNAGAINKRFDEMVRRAKKTYGPDSQGNLSRRLLEIETARANALDSNQKNLISAQNNSESNATTRENSRLNAQTNMLNTLGRMEQLGASSALRGTSGRAAAGGSASATMKEMRDQQKFLMDSEEAGYKRYADAIRNMYTTVDEKGNQVVDKAAQESLMAYIEGSNPRAAQELARMPIAEQMQAIQNYRVMKEMNDARNATAASGGGGVTNRMDLPVKLRSMTWDDMWNGDLPMWDYATGFGDRSMVVETESGQVVPRHKYTKSNGLRDLDKEKLLHDSLVARRTREILAEEDKE